MPGHAGLRSAPKNAGIISVFSTLALTAACTAASAAVPPRRARPAAAAGSTAVLRRVGVVNLRALAAAETRQASFKPRRHAGPGRVEPLGRIHPHVRRAGHVPPIPLSTRRITTSRLPGEHGFTGMTALDNVDANRVTVSPPDQALAVGPYRRGTAVIDFVNRVLHVYKPNGETILRTIPAYQIFRERPAAELTDPRARWDPRTGRWFLTMFAIRRGAKRTSSSTQYIAVSDSRDVIGSYRVFSIDTTDRGNLAGDCPCFGDYDQIGADANGFYIETNEFSIAHQRHFNGSIIYAIALRELVAPRRRGRLAVLAYTIRHSGDPFGAFHLSPASTPQGAPSPDTEYFVESDGALPFDNRTNGTGLEVYALLGTARLDSGHRPPLVRTRVVTEAYSQPPDAPQKAGPLRLGKTEGSLKTNFNAVQHVTYAAGLLYAELSTGFGSGPRARAGAAWFVLQPAQSARSIVAFLANQGTVETIQHLLYPVIGVDARGRGYIAFALSGEHFYPSAAYMYFLGADGAVGDVHVEAGGTAPLDDFTCYPPASDGTCRYGDYSAAQAYNGRIYLATEYAVRAPRSPDSNWATRVWSAPVPPGPARFSAAGLSATASHGNGPPAPRGRPAAPEPANLAGGRPHGRAGRRRPGA